MRGWCAGLLLSAAWLWPSLTFANADRYRRDLAAEARKVFGPDAPIAILAAQIEQESGWNEAALSRVGAEGLAQFMPATRAWIAELYPELAGLNGPRWQFRAQALYMKWLLDRVKGLDCWERQAFALAGYNGGLGNVYARQRLSPMPLVCLFVTCMIRPSNVSVSNQIENERYSRRILLTLTPRYAHWGRSC